MIELALSKAERDRFRAALVTDHRIRIEVDVLDRDEKVIESLAFPAARVLSGAVEVNARADITRSLRMVFLDPNRKLQLDSASPRRGALFAENMLRVTYGVYVPADGWRDVPVFWGPLTSLERHGAEVSVEAQGKEVLALDPHFATKGYTLSKGIRVDTAIRRVMDKVGENRYNLPNLSKRLPRQRAVQMQDEPWDVVKFGWESSRRVKRGRGKNRHRERIDVEYNGLITLAGKNYRLFYDGRGRLTAKQRTSQPVYVFREGTHLLSHPTVNYDVLTARNHVVVTGAKVTVGKKPNRRQVQMRGRATLQSAHPISPYALRRNGVKRYMTEWVDAENLKTKKACTSRAAAILKQRSRDGLEVSFETLPVPHLEELDTVSVVTDEFALEFPLTRWTLPLTAGEPMQVGWGTE